MFMQYAHRVSRNLRIKTHGSVSCGPRSRRATPVSILTGIGNPKAAACSLLLHMLLQPVILRLQHRLGNPKAAAHVAVRPSVLVTVKC